MNATTVNHILRSEFFKWYIGMEFSTFLDEWLIENLIRIISSNGIAPDESSEIVEKYYWSFVYCIDAFEGIDFVSKWFHTVWLVGNVVRHPEKGGKDIRNIFILRSRVVSVAAGAERFSDRSWPNLILHSFSSTASLGWGWNDC